MAGSETDLSAERLRVLEGELIPVLQALSAMALAFSDLVGVAEESKSDGSPVTRADRGIESEARRLLAPLSPYWGFFGEEFGGSVALSGVGDERPLDWDRDTFWLCDPIDGTKCFLGRVPTWSILLALIHGGEPVLGAVVLPCLGELFLASRGNGTRCGDLAAGLQALQPCRVSGLTRLEGARLSYSSTTGFAERAVEPWFFRLLNRHGRLRTDSDAFGYTRVLVGACDAMLDPIVAPYDLAAVQVLFQECSGAFFASWHGDESSQAYRCGCFLGAASPSLGRALLKDFWSCLDDSPMVALVNRDSHSFSERFSFVHTEFQGEVNDGKYWLAAAERALAGFCLAHPRATVDDLAVIAQATRVLGQSLHNGVFAESGVDDDAVNLTLWVVVDGAVVTLPLSLAEDSVESIRAGLEEAWELSQQQETLVVCRPAWERSPLGPDSDVAFRLLVMGVGVLRSLFSPSAVWDADLTVTDRRVSEWSIDGALRSESWCRLEVAVHLTVGDSRRRVTRLWTSAGTSLDDSEERRMHTEIGTMVAEVLAEVGVFGEK